MRFRFLLVALMFGGMVNMLPSSGAQPAAAQPAPKCARGHIQPTEAYRKAIHAEARKRNDNKVGALPTATPTTFDCRTQGWVGPVDDQGNCGSCWDVATCDQITNAYIRSGLFPKDGSKRISPQYILDGCGPANGGCGGDWGTTVLGHARSTGIPIAADYGPYRATVGSCKFKAGTALYKVDDWGFCTPDQSEGMSTTQDIKNAIVAYGSVSTAIAANADWDSYSGGVMKYRRLTANDVNHEVQISGWDDTKTVSGTSAKGAFLVRNQWGTSWGEAGYAWIGYGSHQIGTEACWVSLAIQPPLPPVPPVPPVPPTPPTPGKGFTGTMTYVNGSLTTVVPTTNILPAPELGQPYTVDLSKYGFLVRLRLKNKIANAIDHDSITVTDNGTSLTITPKAPVGPDGAVGAIDWAAFLDFITKLLPIILQIISIFGGL